MDCGHQNLTCSFCGEGRNHSRKLIAGPAVYICEQCVALGAKIVAGEDAPSDLMTKVDVAKVPVGVSGHRLLCCHWCGKCCDEVKAVVTCADTARKLHICNECVDLCQQIIGADAEEPG